MELELVFPVGSFPPAIPLCGKMELIDPRNLVVYARKLDVINRGLSGFNTEWAIPVFEQVSWAYFFDQGVKTGRLNNQRL